MNLAEAAVAHLAFDTPDKRFTHVDSGYTPRVKLYDDENGRRYVKDNGIAYTSVTTVKNNLDVSGIYSWKQRMADLMGLEKGLAFCDNHMKESMDVGTRLHEIVERYLNNEPAPPEGERAEDSEYLLAFNPRRLFDSMKHNLNRIDNIRGVEIAVHSDEMQLAGTVDCVADFDGRLAIIDHKNSRSQKGPAKVRGYRVQAATYAHMWEEMTGERPEITVINVAPWDLKPRVYIQEFTEEEEEASLETIKFCREHPDDLVEFQKKSLRVRE